MFSRKNGLRACFYIADFGSFGWGKTRSKKSRREVNWLCQCVLHVFSHDCFITFRPEIVEIVGDSYDSKRSPLKSVAFKTGLNMQGRVLQHLSEHRLSKTKELKKKQRERTTRHTNKQAIKQINKRTNKETNKNKQAGSPVFFWSDAMVGAIACGQTKQIKRQ